MTGRAGISAEMAIRLDKAFGGGAETWLRLQAAYDLAHAQNHAGKIKCGVWRNPATRFLVGMVSHVEARIRVSDPFLYQNGYEVI
jgi:hypothetical protein